MNPFLAHNLAVFLLHKVFLQFPLFIFLASPAWAQLPEHVQARWTAEQAKRGTYAVNIDRMNFFAEQEKLPFLERDARTRGSAVVERVIAGTGTYGREKVFRPVAEAWLEMDPQRAKQVDLTDQLIASNGENWQKAVLGPVVPDLMEALVRHSLTVYGVQLPEWDTNALGLNTQPFSEDVIEAMARIEAKRGVTIYPRFFSVGQLCGRNQVNRQNSAPLMLEIAKQELAKGRPVMASVRHLGTNYVILVGYDEEAEGGTVWKWWSPWFNLGGFHSMNERVLELSLGDSLDITLGSIIQASMP